MYLSALIFGLLGSVHCAVMCGPIAMVLPKGKHFFNQLSYNFGRISSYLIIGGIFGLIGKGMFLVGLFWFKIIFRQHYWNGLSQQNINDDPKINRGKSDR